MWATPPDGEKESIFWINDWAFSWQSRYQYAQPRDLPKGTKIDVELVYDNSEDNPQNPHDPPRRVNSGLQSTDEMGSVTLLMVAKNEHDVPDLKRAIRRPRSDHMSRARGLRGFRGLGSDWLEGVAKRLDKHQNGILEKAEIPYRYRRQFRKFDKNGDGDLDRKELLELKKSGRSILDSGGRRRDD